MTKDDRIAELEAEIQHALKQLTERDATIARLTARVVSLQKALDAAAVSLKAARKEMQRVMA